MAQVLGRENESARVEAFLARSRSATNALVLDGAPGIGKSTLWLAAVQGARERGFQVLTSRPAESERLLANVVLGDLFGDVTTRELEALPAPRRRAFEAALLMQEDLSAAVDVRALGVAIVTLLTMMAATAPLLVAIDDDQWMDSPSATTLAFALRRLEGSPVSLLLARRMPEVPPTALEEALPATATERLRVGPLSLGAVTALVRDRVGIVLSRQAQVRLHEVSAGNPFYALEVARSDAAARSADTSEAAMVPAGAPARLDHLLEARVAALDDVARDALLLVAANGRLPVEASSALAIPVAALEAARRAGLVHLTDRSWRFTHPLLASAVYNGATPESRRAAHRRLAEVLEDPLHRARHVALAADGPDPELAADVEAAARLARDRGVSIAAAELADHALRLTPPDRPEEWRTRTAAAARAHSAAGDGARARELAGQLLAEASAGRARAEALLVAAEFELPARAVELLEQALGEADGAPELQGVIHAGLAEGRYFEFLPDPQAAAHRHAAAALELAERLDDDRLRATALSTMALIRFGRGEPGALELAERAFRIADGLGDAALRQKAGGCVGHILTWLGDADRARAWLEVRLAESIDRDERLRAEVHFYLTLVELYAGRWDLAAEYGEDPIDQASEYGTQSPVDFFPAALVALHRGDLARARGLVERAKSFAGEGQQLESYHGVLGACELWSGNRSAAVASFARAEEANDLRGLDEPSMREWRPEYVEALLQLGRIDAAEALVDDWEAAARRLDRHRVLATALRCRGLVASARGRPEAAIELLEEAVDRLTDAGDPYGRARAQLALGVNRRRTRRKRAAREALASALETFEELGAAYWTGVAKAELAKIGGRSRSEGLSPAERSVAALVAEGRTNREIASMLFLGERTVASHLTHVYAKLGLRSRTELAHRFATADEPASTVGAAHSSADPRIKVPTS